MLSITSTLPRALHRRQGGGFAPAHSEDITVARIKMSDVARAAGVSTMTVSRALNHHASIAPATRQRILKVVADLGYVPDRIAGGFSSQRSGFVSLLVPSLNNPHFAETAAGLQEVLAPRGLQLLIGLTHYRSDEAENMIATMLARRPEALLVTYDQHTPRARSLLEGAGVPIIELWELPPNPIHSVVGFSNRSAAAAMTRHLIEIGRKRIVFIGETDDTGTRGAARRQGFVDAMRAARLDAKRTIAVVRPPISMLDGRAAANEALKLWPDTDAIMCVSDPAAFGALTACIAASRRVPDDIAISGFGDFEVGRCAIPAISTIAVSGLEIGRRAAELVMDLLDGDKGDPQIVEVSALPALRSSTR
jgi:LacI family gluconate utilization system Gnt-I transcriptional repressor